MIQLTLLTRGGCHLCEHMKTVVASVGEHRPIALREVDIGTDRDLEEKFGQEIPILLHDDQVIARYRISVADLLARLEDPERQTG